jgi:hypothetical protein
MLFSAITKINLEAGESITFKLSTGELVKVFCTKSIEPELRQDRWACYHLYDDIVI